MQVKLLFLICLLCTVTIKGQKICASEADSDACQQLARDLKFACKTYLHNVDCLLGIESNQSHVGTITGEQALLGANLLSDNVVVLGEIRSDHPVPQTVVIVKSSIPNGFINLKDKKLCHPGFRNDPRFSPLLLQELENAIIKLNETFCVEENVTLVEKHVRAIRYFFGNSCRPGLWSQDIDFDTTLKQKYDSLCSLCGPDKCDTDYLDPLKNSLECLTQNDADVAITTLKHAVEFFNSSENRNNYKYLCKDGTSRSYAENCTWSSQLPNLLVAEKNLADEVQSYLQDNLNGHRIHHLLQTTVSTTQKKLDPILSKILRLNSREKILLLSSSGTHQSLKAYVQERRAIPTIENSKQCDRSIKWCTFSDAAHRKCEWLSQAAMNWGIQPVVECVKTSGGNELSCLDDVKKGSADIIVASSDHAYVSLNKGLKTIAYPETEPRHLSTVLVVKKANDTSIKTFSDLRGKGACIPRFGGKEHLSFIDTLRKINVVDDTNCDYGNLLSDFVGSSCVPGIRSNLIKESTDETDKDKLCSQCRSINVSLTATFCNDDARNKYYGSKGALECLPDGAADFAVISKIDVDNSTSDYYQVICKNGSLSSREGLQVDDDCALDIIATSEVMSLGTNPNNFEIVLALEEFEKWFGQYLEKSFHLFDRFNGTLDLLFRDSTPGLSFSGSFTYMKNYQQLLERAKDCSINGAITTSTSIFVTMLAFVVLFFNYS